MTEDVQVAAGLQKYIYRFHRGSPMDRRAQTATEYLVILAVVIVIALIVVGVLGGFPQFGAGGQQRSEDAYWQQADIGIVEHSFGDLAISMRLKLRNNMQKDILLSSVTLGDFSGDTIIFNRQVLIRASTTYVIDSSNYLTGKDCSAGVSYAYDVTFTYYDPETLVLYTF